MTAKPTNTATAQNKYTRARVRAHQQVTAQLEICLDHPKLRLLNDLRLQTSRRPLLLDHLIVHASGIIIVENRSETARLEVSPLDQWTQHYQGKALRISSPVEQVKRKAQLLKALLSENALMLRESPHSFEELAIDTLVTIPAAGDVVVPAGVNYPELCRPQGLNERLMQLIKRQTSASRRMFGLKKRAERTLKKDELFRLTAFLRTQHEPLEQATGSPNSSLKEPVHLLPSCEACGSSNLYVKHQQGYFFACFDCNHNTAISRRCRSCRRRGYIRQDGQSYVLECEHCLSTQPVFERRLEKLRWL